VIKDYQNEIAIKHIELILLLQKKLQNASKEKVTSQKGHHG